MKPMVVRVAQRTNGVTTYRRNPARSSPRCSTLRPLPLPPRPRAIFYNYFMHFGAAGALAELSRLPFVAINAVRAAHVNTAAISDNEQHRSDNAYR